MYSSRKIIETLIQVLALTVLIGWCFRIIEPFITPLVWGCILAVAIFPVFKKLSKLLKGKEVLSAVIITIILLLLIILPAIYLGVKTGEEIRLLTNAYQQGQLSIPPAPENIKNWPLIGSKVFTIWQDASTNIELLIKNNPDIVSKVFNTTLSIVTSTGKGIIIFIVSIIISGVFLSYKESSEKYARFGFERLMGNIKSDMTSLAASTIRTVVKGVFGVTLIQTTLAGIGFFAAGIPAASLITLGCFILGIMQIGMLPITLSVVIYSWATMSFTKALIFTIWMLLVGFSDNIIKPWILSKGAAVPMLVLFIGSLGGFIYSGFVGLFTGAVVFTLGYKLFIAWIEGNEL